MLYRIATSIEPIAFGGVMGVSIPPFSATLAYHVPVMLSMLISPLVAFMVAAGSALGFLIKHYAHSCIGRSTDCSAIRIYFAKGRNGGRDRKCTSSWC